MIAQHASVIPSYQAKGPHVTYGGVPESKFCLKAIVCLFHCIKQGHTYGPLFGLVRIHNIPAYSCQFVSLPKIGLQGRTSWAQDDQFQRRIVRRRNSFESRWKKPAEAWQLLSAWHMLSQAPLTRAENNALSALSGKTRGGIHGRFPQLTHSCSGTTLWTWWLLTHETLKVANDPRS